MGRGGKWEKLLWLGRGGWKVGDGLQFARALELRYCINSQDLSALKKGKLIWRDWDDFMYFPLFIYIISLSLANVGERFKTPKFLKSQSRRQKMADD